MSIRTTKLVASDKFLRVFHSFRFSGPLGFSSAPWTSTYLCSYFNINLNDLENKNRKLDYLKGFYPDAAESFYDTSILYTSNYESCFIDYDA